METFIDFEPNKIDRFRWYRNGNRVLCNSCWWKAPDENHDQCPDCNSDKLEWIMNREDDYGYMMAVLQSIKPIVSN